MARRRLGWMAGLALAALPQFAAADYTSQIKVGNWAGGAWADKASKEFRNCGAAIKLAAGTELTVIVGSNFLPLFVIADARIQAQPRQQLQAPMKFDDSAQVTGQGLALSATMVQLLPPAFPNAYDGVRKARRFGFVLPGLNTTVDVTGLNELMPRLYDCVVAERGRMTLPPSRENETTAADRAEVFATLLVAAEKAAVSPYVVVADKDRPSGFEHAVAVLGHLAVPGPDGASNVLAHAHFYPVIPGQTIARMREPRRENLRKACNDASFLTGDLPAIANKPSAIGIFVSCRGGYEEIYILPRRNGGQIEIALSGPPNKRRTLEAVGAKYRNGFAALP